MNSVYLRMDDLYKYVDGFYILAQVIMKEWILINFI